MRRMRMICYISMYLTHGSTAQMALVSVGHWNTPPFSLEFGPGPQSAPTKPSPENQQTEPTVMLGLAVSGGIMCRCGMSTK